MNALSFTRFEVGIALAVILIWSVGVSIYAFEAGHAAGVRTAVGRITTYCHLGGRFRETIFGLTADYSCKLEPPPTYRAEDESIIIDGAPTTEP